MIEHMVLILVGAFAGVSILVAVVLCAAAGIYDREEEEELREHDRT